MAGKVNPQTAADFFKSDSVQFDNAWKWNDQKAWPFFTALIPNPYLPGTDALWGTLGIPGHLIPAGAVREVPIVMEQDSVYRMINNKLRPCSFHPGIAPEAGTIASVNATTGAVVGVGTSFTTVFGTGTSGRGAVFAYETATGQAFGIIASVTDNLNLTLELGLLNPFAATGGTNTYSRGRYSCVVTDTNFQEVSPSASAVLAGTVTAVAGSTAIVGVGTAFLTDFSTGDIIEWNTGPDTFASGVIASVTDNLNLVLKSGAPAAGAGVIYRRLTNPILKTSKFISLSGLVRMSIAVRSNAAREIVGGTQSRIVGGIPTRGETPIKLNTVHGQKNGVGQLRIPYLMPREAHLIIRITNDYSKDVFINGHIFNYKIALSDLESD